ncbi:methyl coenzyme M reductase alpha subunit [Desulfosalsimonas propionicica]|uniref:Methyl coenzyme M reductase alpha subunit n=1 Tax=Desulfosalsimonas propionicica TaxID=332175 RepID=A0A7W0C994_9BACT|nr:hypothetical protein [Desulfosalsimonas propionicica]MBA2881457.1 methyl coenzyme M reductase alpha subunit [Desulfosalsimonas propionicica]
MRLYPVEKNLFKRSAMLIVMLSALCAFAGCASDLALSPSCRHKAVYCAITAREYMPVRIARGTFKDVPHAQAQGYFNDQWQNMEIAGDWIVFIELPGFKASKFNTITDYLHYLYTIDHPSKRMRMAQKDLS